MQTVVGKTWFEPVELPAFPSTLAAIVDATQRPDVALAELGRLVAADPGFAVRVLRLVNSSFHTRGNQIASVHKAVSILGLQSLKNLALTTAATGGADVRALYPFDMRRFWEESLRRAAACEVLAESRAFGIVDVPSAFTAGLLQDLPVLTLIRSNLGKGESWMNLAGAEPELRRREERKFFGMSHDELAVQLCEAWSLPKSLAMPMIHHHRHENAPAEFQAICHLHELAELLAAVYGADDTATAWRTARTEIAPLLPAGGEAEVDRMIERVGARVTSAARSLGIMVSEQPDLDRLRQLAKRSAEMGDLNRKQLVARVKRLHARNEALQSELIQMRELVDTLSATDAVTGLPNERALEARLALEVRRAARSGRGVALIAMQLSVAAGVDPVEAQQLVAVALGATMRVTDVVARIGDGRFELLLPDTNMAGAFVAARRALVAVRGQETEGGDREPPWTLSCGIGCLEGVPSGKFQCDRVILRLRGRGQENLRAALGDGRPLVRTDRETIPWTVGESSTSIPAVSGPAPLPVSRAPESEERDELPTSVDVRDLPAA